MTTANTLAGAKTPISKQELKERIESKLLTRGVSNPRAATNEQLYSATVNTVKEIMIEYRNDFKKRIKATGAKKIYYLCMEFLVGRALKNDTTNLGIYDSLCEIFAEFGVDSVIYGHLHGKSVRADKLVVKNGIKYYLTSCDQVDNKLTEIEL